MSTLNTELPPLQDSAASSLKINQYVHVLMNKFENLPDCGNLFPIMLNLILNIFLISVQILIAKCKSLAVLFTHIAVCISQYAFNYLNITQLPYAFLASVHRSTPSTIWIRSCRVPFSLVYAFAWHAYWREQAKEKLLTLTAEIFHTNTKTTNRLKMYASIEC